MHIYISLGRAVSCQHGAFSGVGAFVVSFVPAECPVGGGMWGIFGKPLKRAIRNTPGLHAVLTTCTGAPQGQGTYSFIQMGAVLNF